MAELARRQHGVVARGQLVALGVPDGAIRGWLRTGRLHSLHRGVYAVGHAALPRWGSMMAAVLACGPGAALSHVSAAVLWGILRSARARVDVTARRSRHGQRGIAVHRVRDLDPRDVVELERIPVTTVPRTLLDLAAMVPYRRLERAYEEAERLRVLDTNAVRAQLRRSRGHHGAKALGLLIARLVDVETDTRSELEFDFVHFCHDHGLPRPTMNGTVAGHAVDAHWPGRPLVVELDSRGFHLTPRAFEEDRVRDADLLLAGYRVLRVTDRRMRGEPARVAGTIRALLASG